MNISLEVLQKWYFWSVFGALKGSLPGELTFWDVHRLYFSRTGKAREQFLINFGGLETHLNAQAQRGTHFKTSKNRLLQPWDSNISENV